MKTAAIVAYVNAIVLCAAPAFSQDTAARAELTTEGDTLTPAQEATLESDQKALRTVVLLGEKVSVEKPDSSKGPFVDMEGISTATLGGRVIDLTTHGLTIAQTAETVKKALASKPDVAVVFTGYSDEKAGTERDKQRNNLGIVAETLKNNGARVFLVPASTTLGASGSANLRLVASDLDLGFVPLGTEVGGQPIQDAFDTIRDELQAPSGKPVTATGNMVGTINHGKIATPAQTSSTAEVKKEYEAARVSMQEELNRVAGQSSDVPQLNQMTTESLLAAPVADTRQTSQTYPEGGTMTKRGKDAQENINMRPLPAVKAFRPQVPVPRNEINKKEPDLSR